MWDIHISLKIRWSSVSRLSDADAYLRNSAGMSLDDFPFFNAHRVDLISFLSGGPVFLGWVYLV